MLRHVWKLNSELKSSLYFLNCKRFKGHSHWQNVRHIKQTADGQRSLLITMYMRKMQGIINAHNGDANPNTNSALANALEEARKNHLPLATFNGFLKKVNNPDVQPYQTFFKGPENIVIAINYDRKRHQFFRQALKKVCRDCKVNMHEMPNGDEAFSTKGVIISKAPKGDMTSAEAEEAAIVAGAEEVDEMVSGNKEDKVFQFITLFEDLFKVVKELKEQGWEMYEHKHELVPLYFVEVPEEKLPPLYNLITSIEEIPEVNKVTVNIA